MNVLNPEDFEEEEALFNEREWEVITGGRSYREQSKLTDWYVYEDLLNLQGGEISIRVSQDYP